MILSGANEIWHFYKPAPCQNLVSLLFFSLLESKEKGEFILPAKGKN
jgi:hypothetical protein